MANNNLILRTLNSPYIGNSADFTRNSVLSHKDVDNNFIFLKGEDIITGSTSGTTLILTQVNNDIIEIDLLPLLNCPDNVTTGSTLVGSSLYFDTKDALSAYTVDLSSLLDNTDNFTTGTTLVGHSLYFDRTNALSAYTVDLSSISGDTNTDNFTTGTTVIGGTAFFDRTDALSAFTLDLSSFTANTDTNYFTTGSTIIGNTAYFDRNDTLSAFTLDVSSLTANTDTNDYTTGTTLVGNVIHYNRTDTLSAFTTDLSGIIPITDYGNIIFVSEVGPTGQTRADVVGDINKPVDLEWASSIAQSGDTIHVKAGTYNVTTTAGNGLSVNGVNHYFEENAKVYKSTSGTTFSIGGLYSSPLTEANVYGSGSFYASGSPGTVFEGAKSAYSTGFSSTFVFEFDECTNVSGHCIDFGLAPMGDMVIRGKNKLASSGGNAFRSVNGNAMKTMIDCPSITSDTDNAIFYGQGGGGSGDLIINSNIITGVGSDFYGPNGIRFDGTQGRLICDAMFISSVKAQSARYINVRCARLDFVYTWANSVTLNAHVGRIEGYVPATLDVNLCDEFNLIDGPYSPYAVANVTMSSFTGATNEFRGGTLNLRNIKTTQVNQEYNPGATLPTWVVGPKNYLFNGGKVNLLDRWDNGDVITKEGLSDTTLNIDSNAYIKETTINVNSGKLEVRGKTYDCDINLTGGTIVMNGATMLVSDQNKHIITAPNSGSTVKVYSGGLNTNKIGPLTGATEMLKVNVVGTSASLTVNGQTFTSTTGATAAASAVELVSLINASGSVNATASQDTPGVDTYIYVTSDIVGTALTMTYGFNTILDSQIRANNNSITDTVGGTIIEDTDID